MSTETGPVSVYLDSLRALCDAATPGPWTLMRLAADAWYDVMVSAPADPSPGEVTIAGVSGAHDAAFIAAARAAVPALIAEVERLRAEVRDTRAILDGAGAEVARLRTAERRMREFIAERLEANRDKGSDDEGYRLEPSIILRAYEGLDPWGDD